MRLVTNLAKKILNEVESLITENIIVVNSEGTIIASTDKSRVGVLHEGAKIVMNTKEKLYITNELAKKLEGVRPGINLPIIYEKDVIGVIGITGIPNDVEHFAELIRGMTELIIREANYIEKKEWETRGLESFFYEWIYTNEVDQNFVSRGDILGISLETPYQCILFQVQPSLSSEDLQQIQNHMDDWFVGKFPRNKDDFLIRWGHGRFILIKSQNTKMSYSKLSFELSNWQKTFEKQHNVFLAIGVGKSIENKTIFKSYQEAKKALKIAIKNTSVVFYDSLLLDIILEEVTEATKEEYLNRVFSSINEDILLIETIQAYFVNNQSLKNTAIDLHVHINTLHYRLNQIKTLTGIDPKSSEGTALFYVALSLKKMI